MTKVKKLLIGAIIFNIFLIANLILIIVHPIKFENENIAFYYEALPYILALITSILSLFVYITLNSDVEEYGLKEEIFMAFWSVFPLASAFQTKTDERLKPFLVISIIYLLLLIYTLVGKARKPRNTYFKIRQLAKISIILNAIIYGPLIYIFMKIDTLINVSYYVLNLILTIIPILSFIIILILYISKKLLQLLSINSVKLNIPKLFMFFTFVIQIISVILLILLIIDLNLYNKTNYKLYLNGFYLLSNAAPIVGFITYVIHLKNNQYDHKKDEIFLLYWSFYPLAIYFISNLLIILVVAIAFLGLIAYNLFGNSKPYEVFFTDMKKASIRILVVNIVVMAIQIDATLLLRIFEVKDKVILQIFQYVPLPIFIIFMIIHLRLIRNFKLQNKYEKKIDY